MCCLVCRRRKPDVKTITWEADEESKCELIDLFLFCRRAKKSNVACVQDRHVFGHTCTCASHTNACAVQCQFCVACMYYIYTEHSGNFVCDIQTFRIVSFFSLICLSPSLSLPHSLSSSSRSKSVPGEGGGATGHQEGPVFDSGSSPQ